MPQPEGTVQVVVDLTSAEAAVLARVAVTVTSALDCRDVNAAERGLRAFREAVGQALSRCADRKAIDRPAAAKPSRRAS